MISQDWFSYVVVASLLLPLWRRRWWNVPVAILAAIAVAALATSGAVLAVGELAIQWYVVAFFLGCLAAVAALFGQLLARLWRPG